MEETTEISFYNLLKKYNFSDEDASKFVALQKQMHIEHLATKTDIANVKADLAQAESRIKSVLTWRMLMFWIGQIGVFLAFAYKLFPGM
jgi:hypothetical protein